MDVVCLLNIGGFTGANGIAERLQIAGNDGAVHADLLGDLLLGVSGEVQLATVRRRRSASALPVHRLRAMVVLPFV